MASEGALQDLRVIELTDVKGQYCGKLLADMGADVIKIEPPGGSSARRIGPFLNDIPHLERSLHFWHYNTSKRGITLNLETEDGRGLFRLLLEKADILVESLDPGYLGHLNLSYDALRLINPGLIMVSISPFGQTGPHRDYKASDLVSLAMAGPLWSCGYDDHSLPPVRGGGSQGYHTGCHYAFIGVLMALIFRDRTGEGQYIDASIQEALACCNHAGTVHYFYEGKVSQRQTGRHAMPEMSPPVQVICKDGRYMYLRLPRDMQLWGRLVDWMRSEKQLGDLDPSQYKTGADIGRDSEHIFKVLADFAAQHTADEMFHQGQRLEMPAWGAVRAPHDLLTCPQLKSRGFFVEVEHPELGVSVTYPGAPYLFGESPWKIKGRAPLIGEHNVEVYVDELGLSKAQVVSLWEAGVI